MAPQRIDAAAIDVAIHQEYDRDELLQHLVDAGYERVDLVERRGHFSVRGDIVDIYAVNEPQPLRLEFLVMNWTAAHVRCGQPEITGTAGESPDPAHFPDGPG